MRTGGLLKSTQETKASNEKIGRIPEGILGKENNKANGKTGTQNCVCQELNRHYVKLQI